MVIFFKNKYKAYTTVGMPSKKWPDGYYVSDEKSVYPIDVHIVDPQYKRGAALCGHHVVTINHVLHDPKLGGFVCSDCIAAYKAYKAQGYVFNDAIDTLVADAEKALPAPLYRPWNW